MILYWNLLKKRKAATRALTAINFLNYIYTLGNLLVREVHSCLRFSPDRYFTYDYLNVH